MNISTNELLKLSKDYSNWLPIIQWSGWLVITFIMAKLFWLITMHLLMPDVSNQKVIVDRNGKNTSVNQQRIDVNSLVNKHLFGSSDVIEAPAEEQIIERETRLKLTLRGIYAADVKERSNAIIEAEKGEQKVYFIDDKLEVPGRVYLRQVYMDRVILETNGVKEVLKLKDVVPNTARKSNPSSKLKMVQKKKVQDKRNNQMVTRSLNKYKQQLQDDPLSLMGVVNAQPKMVNGEMIGIQISAGKDKRLFTQLGLRARDVVTSVNGVRLNNIQDAMQLLNDTQNMQELQVDIERNGSPISLLVNLDPSVTTFKDKNGK